MSKNVLPPGVLEMMILKVIAQGRVHGWGIARKIHVLSEEALRVEEGSLYPTLSRMHRKGWIASEIGVSENNRQAKYYSLTQAGTKKLEAEKKAWNSLVLSISKVIGSESISS